MALLWASVAGAECGAGWSAAGNSLGLSLGRNSCWSVLIQARQPAQPGCADADRQDRNVRRRLSGLGGARLVAIGARRRNPFAKTGQHPLRCALRGGVALIGALDDRPQAVFDLVGA